MKKTYQITVAFDAAPEEAQKILDQLAAFLEDVIQLDGFSATIIEVDDGEEAS